MKSLFYFVLLPALLPVAVLLFYIYRKDRFEREPFYMLAKVFIFGAAFSLLDIPTERVAHSAIATIYPYASISFEVAKNFFGIALIEEVTKWAVIMIFVWKSKNFNSKFDGVVYASTASLGFAALENIIYVMSYGTDVALSRAIFAIPGHCAFGVLMGFFFVRAKQASLKNEGTRTLFYLLLSLAIPTLVHGTYDFLLSPVSKEQNLYAYFSIFVAVLDVVAWRVIRRESKTDVRFVGQATILAQENGTPQGTAAEVIQGENFTMQNSFSQNEDNAFTS